MLPEDPSAAIRALEETSRTRPVVVFKFSPICPISHRAQARFEAWRDGLSEGAAETHLVDVIGQKPLARGLTAALDVQHESPQALVFVGGALRAHASHDALVADWFDGSIAG